MVVVVDDASRDRTTGAVAWKSNRLHRVEQRKELVAVVAAVAAAAALPRRWMVVVPRPESAVAAVAVMQCEEGTVPSLLPLPSSVVLEEEMVEAMERGVPWCREGEMCAMNLAVAPERWKCVDFVPSEGAGVFVRQARDHGMNNS
jgi:hypothetical protein